MYFKSCIITNIDIVCAFLLFLKNNLIETKFRVEESTALRLEWADGGVATG